jgi:hypothetical protein
MTPTTQATRTAPTAQALLRDIGFVLALTQKVKDEMKATPAARVVSPRVAGRKQLGVAA